MTKEEAAGVLKAQADYYGKLFESMVTAGDYLELWELEKRMEAFEIGADALRGPQPDPKTGLVPCGCGGKAMHMVWPDENFPNGLRRYVICGKCMTETSGFNETNGQAANRWNRAMGRASE